MADSLPAPLDVAHRSGMFFILEAAVLAVLGILAIFLPLLAGIAITVFLGWLLLLGGAIGTISAIATRDMPGFSWSILSALLALVAGAFLIAAPLRGLLSITLILSAFLFADGIVSALFAVSHRGELHGRWGWMLTSSLVTILLAVIIVVGLPRSATWALGLIVGIDMVMAGSALLAVGVAVRTVKT
jgi:uncharacterized membrane protein HdeD (DUF308 family)